MTKIIRIALLALALVAGAIFVSSCTALDSFERDMQVRWDDYVEADVERWERFQAGSITREEYLAERKAAAVALEEYTEERVVQAKEEVADEIAEATSGPITGNAGVDALIGLVITAVTSAYSVNRYRNAKRVALGEPIKPAPVRPPPPIAS